MHSVLTIIDKKKKPSRANKKRLQNEVITNSHTNFEREIDR